MTGYLRLSDLPEETTLDELLALLGRLEVEELDFKREPAHLHEVFAAMAMTRGGLVVIGVSDDRSLHGAPLTQKLLDTVMRAGAEVGLDIQVRELMVDAGAVTVLAVPEAPGRLVTTPNGRLLRRVGSDNVPLRGEAMARFVMERGRGSEEDSALPTITPADLDLTLINRALDRASRPPVELSGALSALVDLKVADLQEPPADPRVSLAAALLFAHDPALWCRGATVQLVKRSGVGPDHGPTVERHEARGPLPLLFDRCMSFIDQHTRSYEVVVGRERLEFPEYPVEALREAVLNALAHRDYSMTGSTVDITVWEDRVEIRSPGSLPAPITVETMRDQHASRNRRVMHVLKVLGLVEEFGEGVDRMFAAMSGRLMTPPSIVATDLSVTVTLHNRFLVAVEDQAWLSVLSNLNLSPGEALALVIAHREGAVTRRQVTEKLPEVDATALFRGATAKGLLVRQGVGGGVKYVMSPELALRTGSSGVEAQGRKRQQLLDEIHRRGSLSTAEGAVLLGEDATLVRHLLNDLTHAGHVRAVGNTRARRYVPGSKEGPV